MNLDTTLLARAPLTGCNVCILGMAPKSLWSSYSTFTSKFFLSSFLSLSLPLTLWSTNNEKDILSLCTLRAQLPLMHS